MSLPASACTVALTSSLQLDHLAWAHQLRRRFALIVFDWDGTAVADRNESVPRLREALEDLTGFGVMIGIVTGTKLDSVVRQLMSDPPSGSRFNWENLYVLTNRGSEAWSFSESGQPVLRYRYEASLAENQALDEIVQQCQESLARQGVVTLIISDRLNRRKLDVIPIPAWRDPRKSQVRELSIAVEERLRQSGFKGGIAAVVGLVRDRAGRLGFRGARITSDIKHVEVGLTDKGDSLNWIFKNIVLPRGILTQDIAIFGDEFGFIDSLKGSDALMQIPELEEATICSVGPEPRGVPDGVLNIGGGPARFLKFLVYQGELWRSGKGLLEGPHVPTANPAWLIEQEGFDPSREHEMESLFSVGNGFLGVRGAMDLPIPSSQTDLYIAGIYDRKAGAFAYSEPEFRTDGDRLAQFSEIVPFPSFFYFKLRADGMALAPGSSTGPLKLQGHERVLDLKKGILFEIFYFNDARGGAVSLRSLRVASLADEHLLLHEVVIHTEGRAMDIELEPSPPLSDFALRYPHLRNPPEEGGSPDSGLSVFETSVSRFKGFTAVKRALNGTEHHEAVIRSCVQPEQPLVMRRMWSVFSSRDEGGTAETALRHLAGKSWEEFDREIANHSKEWKNFWDQADIQFVEKPAVTQANRFGLYQLRIAAPRSGLTSVGARGLTGRSYEGHVFWDAEIFIFPFFLFALPEAAKNILLYRYHTLSGAKRRAALLGYRGACYAWESTVDGADATPSVIILLQSKKRVPIFTGRQQMHVTADIAHAVWRYWKTTSDDSFMTDFGAEILGETARFWASRVTARNGRFHILAVVGPDEYHHNVNDNAYTNWMARMNLEKAVHCLGWLASHYPDYSKELRRKLALSEEEIDRWQTIARMLYLPQPNEEGIIEQFEGYFRLNEAKISREERLRPPVNRLLHWEEVSRSKLIKQADVLMIPFLFPNAWSREIIDKNFRYYAARTDHGSSLSPSVHAAIASRIGLKVEADRYWEEALNLDLQNLMQNTSLGIHLGNIGGAWQALVFHFLGLRQKGGKLLRSSESSALQFPLGAKDVQLGGV